MAAADGVAFRTALECSAIVENGSAMMTDLATSDEMSLNYLFASILFFGWTPTFLLLMK
jgi:hypothetical protein